jgi:hypothetical protein
MNCNGGKEISTRKKILPKRIKGPPKDSCKYDEGTLLYQGARP